MGDRTVRVAAELADGWFPLFVARDQVLDRVHTLSKDREAAALRTEPLTVVAGPMTVVADDPAVARRISASCVAWYLSAMGDVYARFVAEQGYGAAVQAILEANPHPRPDGGDVPAEAQVVLDQFTAHGTPGQVRDQLAGWNGAVDVAMIGLPPGLPWVTIEATLRGRRARGTIREPRAISVRRGVAPGREPQGTVPRTARTTTANDRGPAGRPAR
jgi:alkanesulfonate monooxygenase SsuD/methylene tetrahydromethanopterin reductase-like flavin-dependent oxidoreductase (luciferase family)